jgi:hypothetical protein
MVGKIDAIGATRNDSALQHIPQKTSAAGIFNFAYSVIRPYSIALLRWSAWREPEVQGAVEQGLTHRGKARLKSICGSGSRKAFVSDPSGVERNAHAFRYIGNSFSFLARQSLGFFPPA